MWEVNDIHAWWSMSCHVISSYLILMQAVHVPSKIILHNAMPVVGPCMRTITQKAYN